MAEKKRSGVSLQEMSEGMGLAISERTMLALAKLAHTVVLFLVFLTVTSVAWMMGSPELAKVVGVVGSIGTIVSGVTGVRSVFK